MRRVCRPHPGPDLTGLTDPTLPPGRRTGPRRAGFSLPEMMAVILIVALLTTLSLPYLLGAINDDRAITCGNQLKLIEAAKASFYHDRLQSGSLDDPASQLAAYLAGGLPRCPAGGAYVYGDQNNPCRCTLKPAGAAANGRHDVGPVLGPGSFGP